VPELDAIGLDGAELRDIIEAALAHLLPDGLNTTVVGFHLGPVSYGHRARPMTALTIRLRSSARTAVLGQYLPFTAQHGRGYHENYIFGCIHAHYLAAHGRDLRHEVQLVLDVEQEGPLASVYEYVAFERAVDRGVLEPTSPLAEACARYGIRCIGLAGNTLTGPSAAMMEVVAEEAIALGAPDVLDLYCGTCALARVALEHGAERVVAVDTELDEATALANLGQYAAGCKLIQDDAEVALSAGDPVDLVVLDPFHDHTLFALEHLGPRLVGRFATAVVNLGPPLPHHWAERVHAQAETCLGPCELRERHGEIVAVVRATEYNATS
jgi:hypothetical protein